MGCHFLPSGDLSNPGGIELASPESPASQADYFTAEPLGKPQAEVYLTKNFFFNLPQTFFPSPSSTHTHTHIEPVLKTKNPII